MLDGLVASKKPVPDPPPFRPHKKYVEFLWQQAEESGALDGLTAQEKATLKQRAVGTGTLDRARALWALAKRKIPKLPPPVIKTRSEEDYRWVMVGRFLRDGDENMKVMFAALLSMLEQVTYPRRQALESVLDAARKLGARDLAQETLGEGDPEDDSEWIEP